MERNTAYNDDNYVMVLNDGETYTGLDGSCIARVLWDNSLAPEHERLNDEEFEALVKSYKDKNYEIWIDEDGFLIAQIVTVFN